MISFVICTIKCLSVKVLYPKLFLKDFVKHFSFIILSIFFFNEKSIMKVVTFNLMKIIQKKFVTNLGENSTCFAFLKLSLSNDLWYFFKPNFIIICQTVEEWILPRTFKTRVQLSIDSKTETENDPCKTESPATARKGKRPFKFMEKSAAIPVTLFL